MIIYMYEVICVTNRKLCREDFLKRIEKIAACRSAAILLREKDLPESGYKSMAAEVLHICRKYHAPCILHSFPEAAIELGAEAIHLPFSVLKNMAEEQKRNFKEIGASCHSTQEAVEAQMLGCTYLTAGHIFETDCKKGMPGRGLDFLKDVVRSVQIPVYAIGGINAQNAAEIRRTGAKGVCVMSSAMNCPDAKTYLEQLKGRV